MAIPSAQDVIARYNSPAPLQNVSRHDIGILQDSDHCSALNLRGLRRYLAVLLSDYATTNPETAEEPERFSEVMDELTVACRQLSSDTIVLLLVALHNVEHRRNQLLEKRFKLACKLANRLKGPLLKKERIRCRHEELDKAIAQGITEENELFRFMQREYPELVRK